MAIVPQALRRWLSREFLPAALAASASGRLAEREPEALSQKASRTGALIAFESLGEPIWSPRDYTAFAREGFMQNAIVYRCVRMISEAAGSIPLLVYEGDREIESHPLLDLMHQPSYDHSIQDFLESWYGSLLVSGNAYVEAVAIGGIVRELHILRPDRLKVIPGLDGWPEGYEYQAGGEKVRFVDEVSPGVRPILHTRLYHPLNDHYGQSPLEAAATAIDIHNEASKWNKALLDNSARPSGALVYAAANGHMTAEQFQRLKDELETSYQGAAHAGRPLLLEGGLDWKPLSLTPKDMDFIAAKNTAAREIALALGVPPMLLGIPGDNTYSNYQEAQRAFWRGTVLPLVNRMTRAFGGWLAPHFALGNSPSSSRPPSAGNGPAHERGALRLVADLDQVEALNGEREALWARLQSVSFLTDDEKRVAAGYAPAEKGKLESSRKYSPDQPRVPAGNSDGGQWTDGGGGNGGGDDVLAGGSGDDELEELADKYAVDLEAQDKAFGGHAIRDHVGKTDQYFVDTVRDATWDNGLYRYGKESEGSFYTKEDANDFVNRTLKAHKKEVDSVASGVYEVILNTRFGFETGREAYRSNADEYPYIRKTYSVRVVLRHDLRSKKRYKVLTAFPVNQRKQ